MGRECRLLLLGVACLLGAASGLRAQTPVVRFGAPVSASPPPVGGEGPGVKGPRHTGTGSSFGEGQPPYPQPLSPGGGRGEKALDLPDLLALAARHNPQLASAWAQAQAARGRMVQAGLYPNPRLSWVFGDMLNPANAAGEQGPQLAQEIVTADKLAIARRAAAHGVAAADWQALTRWYDVVTRVRLAYVEALAAQAEVRVAEELVAIAGQGLAAAEALERAGAGARPDVLRARVDLSQGRQRLDVARRRADDTWRLLGVAVGQPDLPPGPLHGSLTEPVPSFAWQELADGVRERSSELREAWANVAQAEELLRRAQVERVPNVNVQIRPFYDFPEQGGRVEGQIGVALPLFNRNQGNVLAAEADVVRTRAEVRQTELRLADRAAVAFRAYRAAREQVASFERDILPDAAESLRLVRLGYEHGDPKYDYTAVLQAQQALAQSRLAYVRALGDVWRSVGEIHGLLQIDPPPTKSFSRSPPTSADRMP